MIPMNGVTPDTSAVAGTGLEQVVGALLTIVLIVSVAAMIAAAIMWGFGQATGSWQAAHKGRLGVLVAFGAAVLAGAAVALLNFLIGVGSGI